MRNLLEKQALREVSKIQSHLSYSQVGRDRDVAHGPAVSGRSTERQVASKPDNAAVTGDDQRTG